MTETLPNPARWSQAARVQRHEGEVKTCAHTHPQQTTWQEIADHLGVSRMRVFQIHTVALEKLRAGLLNDPFVREKLRMEAKK